MSNSVCTFIGALNPSESRGNACGFSYSVGILTDSDIPNSFNGSSGFSYFTGIVGVSPVYSSTETISPVTSILNSEPERAAKELYKFTNSETSAPADARVLIPAPILARTEEVSFPDCAKFKHSLDKVCTSATLSWRLNLFPKSSILQIEPDASAKSLKLLTSAEISPS